jgi:hypothetical protein
VISQDIPDKVRSENGLCLSHCVCRSSSGGILWMLIRRCFSRSNVRAWS